MNSYTLEELYRLAQNGNTEALVRLGICYRDGSGVEADPSAAAECFLAAAEAGNASGQYQLGICYEQGLGVKEDRRAARGWYQKAAESFYEAAKYGSPQAQYELGNCYAEGRGVEKDPEAAIYWYQAAAQQDYADAQYNLGYCYLFGIGVEANDVVGLKWYQTAAAHGDPQMQHNLGLIYQNGYGNVPRNYGKAAEWFFKAARQGYAASKMELAKIYFRNPEAQKDMEAAKRLMTEAAEDGVTEAGNFLMHYYFDGEPEHYDLKKAYTWASRTVQETRDPSAYVIIGTCLAKGDPIAKDENSAWSWLHEVEEETEILSGDACYYLGMFYQNGTGGEKSYEKALRFYELARDKGSLSAEIGMESLKSELEKLEESQRAALEQSSEESGENSPAPYTDNASVQASDAETGSAEASPDADSRHDASWENEAGNGDAAADLEDLETEAARDESRIPEAFPSREEPAAIAEAENAPEEETLQAGPEIRQHADQATKTAESADSAEESPAEKTGIHKTEVDFGSLKLQFTKNKETILARRQIRHEDYVPSSEERALAEQSSTSRVEQAKASLDAARDAALKDLSSKFEDAFEQQPAKKADRKAQEEAQAIRKDRQPKENSATPDSEETNSIPSADARYDGENPAAAERRAENTGKPEEDTAKVTVPVSGLSVEEKREMASVEDAAERPAAEEKREKTSVEDAAERPAAEEKQGKLSVEEAAERPVAEEKQGKPSVEDRTERPAAEERQEKLSVEDTAERLSVEEEPENFSGEEYSELTEENAGEGWSSGREALSTEPDSGTGSEDAQERSVPAGYDRAVQAADPSESSASERAERNFETSIDSQPEAMEEDSDDNWDFPSSFREKLKSNQEVRSQKRNTDPSMGFKPASDLEDELVDYQDERGHLMDEDDEDEDDEWESSGDQFVASLLATGAKVTHTTPARRRDEKPRTEEAAGTVMPADDSINGSSDIPAEDIAAEEELSAPAGMDYSGDSVEHTSEVYRIGREGRVSGEETGEEVEKEDYPEEATDSEAGRAEPEDDRETAESGAPVDQEDYPEEAADSEAGRAESEDDRETAESEASVDQEDYLEEAAESEAGRAESKDVRETAESGAPVDQKDYPERSAESEAGRAESENDRETAESEAPGDKGENPEEEISFERVEKQPERELIIDDSVLEDDFEDPYDALSASSREPIGKRLKDRNVEIHEVDADSFEAAPDILRMTSAGGKEPSASGAEAGTPPILELDLEEEQQNMTGPDIPEGLHEEESGIISQGERHAADHLPKESENDGDDNGTETSDRAVPAGEPGQSETKAEDGNGESSLKPADSRDVVLSENYGQALEQAADGEQSDDIEPSETAAAAIGTDNFRAEEGLEAAMPEETDLSGTAESDQALGTTPEETASSGTMFPEEKTETFSPESAADPEKGSGMEAGADVSEAPLGYSDIEAGSTETGNIGLDNAEPGGIGTGNVSPQETEPGSTGTRNVSLENAESGSASETSDKDGLNRKTGRFPDTEDVEPEEEHRIHWIPVLLLGFLGALLVAAAILLASGHFPDRLKFWEQPETQQTLDASYRNGGASASVENSLGNAQQPVSEMQPGDMSSAGTEHASESPAPTEEAPGAVSETKVLSEANSSQEPDTESRTEKNAETESGIASETEEKTESETEESLKTETETELSAETETDDEAESGTDAEASAENGTETGTVPLAETEPESEPFGKAETEPETGTEFETAEEPVTEAETIEITEPETVPEAETVTEPESVTEPETEELTEAETETELTTEPETEELTEAERETKPETESETEELMETVSETEEVTEAETETEPTTEELTEAETETESATESETEELTETVPETEEVTEPESVTEPGTKELSEAETETEPTTEPETEELTEAETETEPEAVSEAETESVNEIETEEVSEFETEEETTFSYWSDDAFEELALPASGCYYAKLCRYDEKNLLLYAGIPTEMEMPHVAEFASGMNVIGDNVYYILNNDQEGTVYVVPEAGGEARIAAVGIPKNTDVFIMNNSIFAGDTEYRLNEEPSGRVWEDTERFLTFSENRVWYLSTDGSVCSSDFDGSNIRELDLPFDCSDLLWAQIWGQDLLICSDEAVLYRYNLASEETVILPLEGVAHPNGLASNGNWLYGVEGGSLIRVRPNGSGREVFIPASEGRAFEEIVHATEHFVFVQASVNGIRGDYLVNTADGSFALVRRTDPAQ